MYLDGGNGLEILLPVRYVPVDGKVGDELEVFIYQDNQGRLIATTDRPLAQVGEFRFMKVKSVNRVGAFLEWGIMKDLLVPFSEQKVPMREGKSYLVYIHLDYVSKRIVASACVDKYLDNVMPDYAVNEKVDLLVTGETEIGYKVIVNNRHWGLLYFSEVFQRLERGERLKGYIKGIRDDDKIDVSLAPQGYQKVDNVARRVLESLSLQGGYLPVHDKSDPEEIYSLFHCSKKAFKQAIGMLYKQKRILIEEEGIRTL